jgi:hypothetical protein
MTCFNFNITGGGNATPKGVKFPGAYAAADPGFHVDIYDGNWTAPYPAVGGPVYKSTVASLPASGPPKSRIVVSPTGQGEEADAVYYKWQNAAIRRQMAIDASLDAIGG